MDDRQKLFNAKIYEVRRQLEDYRRETQASILRLTQDRERGKRKLRHSLEQQSLKTQQELEAAVEPIRERILAVERHFAANDLGKFLTFTHAKYEGVFEEIMKDATERAKESKIGISMDLGKGGFLKHVKMALLDVTSPMLSILKDAFEAHPAFQGDGVWDGYVDAVTVTASVTPVDIGMNPFFNRFAVN